MIDFVRPKFYIEVDGERTEIDNVISCIQTEQGKFKVDVTPDMNSKSYNIISDLEGRIYNFIVYIDFMGKMLKTRGFIDSGFIGSTNCYTDELNDYYVEQYGQEYVDENHSDLFYSLAGCIAIKSLYLEVIEE